MKIKETNLKFKDNLTKRNKTDYLVIHHIGNINRDVSAEEIHGWHLGQGWAGCGYHFVVRKDGTVERGRPEWALGSHCKGSNANSIGINVVGDFEQGEPTQKQIDSLIALLKDLKSKYPNTQIKGHRDLMATNCPGNNLYNKLGKVKFYVNR